MRRREMVRYGPSMFGGRTRVFESRRAHVHVKEGRVFPVRSQDLSASRILSRGAPLVCCGAEARGRGSAGSVL